MDLKYKLDRQQTAQAVDRWKALTIGDIVWIKDVPCRIVGVNTGRRRITVTPVPQVLPMPGE